MIDTLVLSSGYEPVNRVTWKRAINQVLAGTAEILEDYGEIVWTGLYEAAGQIFKQLKRPSVIRLLNCFTRKRSIKFSRENILLRDKSKCQYCGRKLTKKGLHLDHVIPKSRGGRTKWTNVVACCLKCNQRKADRTPEQAGMRLRLEPVKPRSLPLVQSLKMVLKTDPDKAPDEWMRHLQGYLYWNVELEQD